MTSEVRVLQLDTGPTVEPGFSDVWGSFLWWFHLIKQTVPVQQGPPWVGEGGVCAHYTVIHSVLYM